MGLPTKRPSVADDYSSYGKQSGVTNLYLLPECDEEDYDPKAELPSNEIETIKETVQPGHKQTAGPFSFKKVARAITKQRKWSTLLKVIHHVPCCRRRLKGAWELRRGKQFRHLALSKLEIKAKCR